MDTQSSLGDILNSLLQNPEVMKTVSSIAANAKNDASEDSAIAEQSEDAPVSTVPEASQSRFSIPPELLSKLPQMMSALSGLGTASLPSKTDDKAHDKDTSYKRKELLRALKPFLSEKRCSVIDGLLQFEGLAGVLDSFKGK